MKKREYMRIMSALLICLLLGGCGLIAPEPTPEPTPAPPTPTPDPHEGMVEVTDGSGMVWIDESEVLIPFRAQMDADAFYVEGDVANYNGALWTLRRGIDVSAYQGEIDWSAVAASGVEFAMIRCGWRGYGVGGTMHEDECYRRNIEGALAAGLDVGVYFFSQATNIYEAAEEGVFTVKLLEGYEIALPVIFDWERQTAEGSRTLTTSGDVVADCCEEFCCVVEGAGYTPGTYFNLHEAYHDYDLDRFAGLKIWISDPDADQPRYYYAHDLWQYSFTGSVPGISGDVDLDVMYVLKDKQ